MYLTLQENQIRLDPGHTVFPALELGLQVPDFLPEVWVGMILDRSSDRGDCCWGQTTAVIMSTESGFGSRE